MKADKDLKIVIIGMGFLAEYLRPCYLNLLGGDLAHKVVGVTADGKDLERKNEACGFPVLLNENRKALDEVHPDIIMFSPPPSVAPELAETVLKPYYAELRKKGELLPDLFAFPPNPPGKYYLDTIGNDIHVCNLLPNMTSVINGKDVATECYNNATFPNEAPWPQENVDRLKRFFAPIGEVIPMVPELVLQMLGGIVIFHNLSQVIFTIADGLKEAGLDVRYQDIASALRYANQVQRNFVLPNAYPCSDKDVDAKLYDALQKVAYNWYEGCKQYYVEIGMEPELADRIITPQFAIHSQLHQLMKREDIEYDQSCHATKGGVLEKGIYTFNTEIKEPMKNIFANYNNQEFGDDFCFSIKVWAHHLADVVGTHGARLSKK